MRRLARHLFTLCSAMSLLLCTAVCVLWVRSYWRGDRVYWNGPDGGIGVASEVGRISAARSHGQHPAPLRPDPGWFYRSFDPHEKYSRMQREFVDKGNVYGFNVSVMEGYWEAGDDLIGENGNYSVFRGKPWSLSPPPGSLVYGATTVVVPHWMLLGLASVLPSCRLFAALRARRRRQKNLCAACGYDLRASPERCPECGRLADREVIT